MSFNACLAVTGVCGIVPRRNPPRNPQALCVVLPDAWNNSPMQFRESSDGVSALKRHRSFIKFDAQYLRGSNIHAPLTGLFDFYGHSVVVQPTFENVDKRRDRLGVTLGDISGLATHRDVAGAGSLRLCRASRAVLRPTSSLVIGHVFIRHGELRAPATNIQFVFDNYISRTLPVPKGFSSEPVVELRELRFLTLSVRDLATGKESARFTFDSAPEDRPLEVRIAALCEVNPLQWPDRPSVHLLYDDEDFRWHYEIMDDPQAIRVRLGGLAFPIPRIIPDPGAGNGLNCMPKLFPAVSFGVPR